MNFVRIENHMINLDKVERISKSCDSAPFQLIVKFSNNSNQVAIPLESKEIAENSFELIAHKIAQGK